MELKKVEYKPSISRTWIWEEIAEEITKLKK